MVTSARFPVDGDFARIVTEILRGFTSLIVLGIETSCDETAVGIVEIDEQQNCTMLANVVATSIDLHKAYGGVVPEIAARSHIEFMLPVVEEALEQAFRTSQDAESDLWERIDAIAVTYGGGLSGSLLVGVMTARTLAITKNKPLYAVNHVEGHVYANFLTKVASTSIEIAAEKDNPLLTAQPSLLRSALPNYTLPSSAPQFPMLALIISGKHSQLALFRDHFDYDLLGWTRDDAVGEAYDKVAKLLGLPYPGGPSVEKAAQNGDPLKYTFPKPRVDAVNESLDGLRARSAQPANSDRKKLPSYDFSFSGLKTAVLRTAQAEIGEDFTFPSFKIAERLTVQQKCDIAASFQRTALEILVEKTLEACREFKPKSLVLAGGVAASAELRKLLTEGMKNTKRDLEDDLPVLQYPDIKLCTDNGAMIATLGCFKAFFAQQTADPYSLEIEPNLTM